MAVVALVTATLAGAWSVGDGAASAAPGATAKNAAAKNAAAKKMSSQLLTLADLPAGWLVERDGDVSGAGVGSGSTPYCNVNDDRFLSKATGSAAAVFKEPTAQDPFHLGESVFSFADPGLARSHMRQLFQQTVSRCRHFTSTAPDGETDSGTATSLRLGAAYDDRSMAYQATVGSGGDVTNVVVAGVVQGSEVMVLGYSGTSDTDLAPFNDLVARASVKLRAGTAHRPTTGAPVAFAANQGVPLPAAADANTDSLGGQLETNDAPDSVGPRSLDLVTPPPVALVGPRAFVATGASLQVLDATSDRPIGSVRAARRVSSADGDPLLTPPDVVRLDGRQVALVGYAVTLPGHGLTAASSAVEIDAVDTHAHRLWDIVVPVRRPSGGVTIVGSSGPDVVVSASASDESFAFDLQTRKVLWSTTSVIPFAVAGGVVVGRADTIEPAGDTSTVVGLNLQTGQTAWKGQTGEATQGLQVGPSTLVVSVRQPQSTQLVLVDARSGKAIRVLDSTGSNWTCQADGRSTVVCGELSVGRENPVLAFDTATGQQLWELPGDGKIAPSTIGGVSQGKVYATVPSGPLVLDARTARVVNESPGVAPLLVDPSVGVAYGAAGELEAYPTSR